MSNSNHSMDDKLSSKSGIKPADDEASTAGQKQPIQGCSDSAKRKTPKDASETATAVATSDTAIGSDLVEDVLMLIFETDFLDTADLLQFRLVSRSWRDSATSVLLRSSACQISFNLLWVPIPSTVKFKETKAVYCNNNNHGALLEDLNKIITLSPKFPCSSFRFVNSYSFGDAHHESKIDTSSLLKFFSIHRNNIKTITVGDLILKSDLCSLLLNYAPGLERLDLQYLKSFEKRSYARFHQPLFPKSVIVPNLKTIVLGQCADFNLMELVDAAINLQSVETTNVNDLKLLLEHGKVGLIKKLECELYVHDLVEFSMFQKLAKSQPKLTKLIVTAERPHFARRNDALSGCFIKMLTFLNRILESSKDTLKYLELRICPFQDIRFPILKNLECLIKLVQSSDQHGDSYRTRIWSTTRPLQWGHVDADEQFVVKKGDQYYYKFPNEYSARLHALRPNRPCDSFPNLKKLQLDIQNYGVEKDGSLILLHTCRSHNKNIVPHFHKSIKVLEIYSKLPKTIEGAKSVSNLFPDVTILKIKCESVQELNCSLWVLSPLAKSIEIYGMSNNYEGVFHEEVVLVDSFFTGYPIELCKKLKGLKEVPPEMEGNPSLINFLRVKPSICDLEDLGDFKMLFTELRAPFASHVSGFYAFGTMPRTKITFAHAAPIKFNEAECEMKKYLAPISTFIDVAHGKVPKGFENDNHKWIYKDNYYVDVLHSDSD